MKSLDYVCIFTGGSIRGGAYIGALKAMQELELNIECFVGSSVGSVMAVLYSAGYSIEELEDIFYEINFDLFKDINIGFSKDFSISKGEHFLEWLREKIEKKFFGEKYEKDKCDPVLFKDLTRDLVVITTDLYTSKIKEFSKANTPDFEVAKAVRISAGMPGLLKPIEYNGHLLVDGDLSRSWPVWRLVPRLLEYKGRILEFRLEGGKIRDNIGSAPEYLNAVFTTFSNFAGDYVITNYKSRDKFDYIRLDAKDVNITDFNLSADKKKELMKAGYETTVEFFKHELPLKRRRILPYYKELLILLKKIKKNIEKSNYNKVRTLTSELFETLVKSKKLIDLQIHNEIVIFYDEFKENLFALGDFFGIMKNREDILNNVEIIISDLEMRVSESENFIEDFSAKS